MNLNKRASELLACAALSAWLGCSAGPSASLKVGPGECASKELSEVKRSYVQVCSEKEEAVKELLEMIDAETGKVLNKLLELFDKGSRSTFADFGCLCTLRTLE